nr:hypothetical protein [Tanacetum cinerariifolium]
MSSPGAPSAGPSTPPNYSSGPSTPSNYSSRPSTPPNFYDMNVFMYNDITSTCQWPFLSGRSRADFLHLLSEIGNLHIDQDSDSIEWMLADDGIFCASSSSKSIDPVVWKFNRFVV